MDVQTFARMSWPEQLRECRRLLNLSCRVSYRTRRYDTIIQRMYTLHSIHEAQVQTWIKRGTP